MPQKKRLIVLLFLVVSSRHTAGAAFHHEKLLNTRAASQLNACRKVRFATYNTSLNRDKAGQLLSDLQTPNNAQAKNISHILQIIRPDVLLLNEFDYYEGSVAVKAFQDNYLTVPQSPGLQPLLYDHIYVAPVNTGIPSGRDWNHDGKSEGPQDCFGYGFHPGQYGMVLLSRFPIDVGAVRTFQHFLWRDMPNALLPVDPETGKPWYSEEDLQVFRLSSKSHWDVPIDIPCEPNSLEQLHQQKGKQAPVSVQQALPPTTKRIHMLLHHPTPPVFDGREHRNRLRNHDEIRFFADYVGCGACGNASSTQAGVRSEGYMYDDQGGVGGIAPGSSFVIMGDHNADPLDGQSYQSAIQQLLGCCNINAHFVPKSEGGKEAGNKYPTDRTPPETKTSSFDLRVDYVLPSRDLQVVDGAVWWPVQANPLSALLEASDHRPVYLDVQVELNGRLRSEAWH